MAQAMPRVQLETGPNPEHCVIWLHGLGADGYDFIPIVRALEEFGVGPTRFVFPHAPKIPVSINGGYVMRAWYDIKNADLMREEDAQGIKDSATSILELIDEQIEQGFDSQNIVLAVAHVPCLLGGLPTHTCSQQQFLRPNDAPFLKQWKLETR